jgi:hypothetical protein
MKAGQPDIGITVFLRTQVLWTGAHYRVATEERYPYADRSPEIRSMLRAH